MPGPITPTVNRGTASDDVAEMAVKVDTVSKRVFLSTGRDQFSILNGWVWTVQL